MTLRERLLEMGKTGFATADVQGRGRGSLHNLLMRMVEKGELHRAKSGPQAYRYFTDPSMAMKFAKEVADKRTSASLVTVKGYGQTLDKNRPIDGYVKGFKGVQVCPSPKEFGPAAKIRGIGQ